MTLACNIFIMYIYSIINTLRGEDISDNFNQEYLRFKLKRELLDEKAFVSGINGIINLMQHNKKVFFSFSGRAIIDHKKIHW